MLLTLRNTRMPHLASISIYADAVLIAARTSAQEMGSDPAPIRAMSIIGAEQAVRAIAAMCSNNTEYQRAELVFTGPSGSMKGKWTGRWTPRARALARGVMHLVALPSLSVSRTARMAAKHTDVVEHVCIAPDGTDEGLRRVVYDRLLMCYNTPLIPVGLPGQPAAELEAAELWRATLTGVIMRNRDLWTPLKSHRDQTDQTWKAAGVLRIAGSVLDELTRQMVRERRLLIPAA